MNLMIAASTVTWDSTLRSLFMVLIFALCGGIIWWVGKYFFSKGPPLVMTVWNGLFILVGAILIINFLLSLVGHQFIGQ